jgi:hypothetical protein
MLCLLGLLLVLVIIFVESNRDLNQLIYALVVLVVLIGGTMISQPTPTPTPTEGFMGFAPVNYNMGSCGGKIIRPEDSIQKNRMSNWDGIKYVDHTDTEDANRQHKWRHSPSNLPLVKDTYITSPIGEDVLLGDDLMSAYYPSVDGQKGSQKRMFMFAQNQVRPECCPSTYSSDRGCLCTTESQRNLIAGRGGNAAPGNDI